MPKGYLKSKEYKLNDFGRWVTVTLKEKRMSQAELARRMDVPKQTLNTRLANNALSLEDVYGIFKVLQPDDKQILKLMKEK